MRHRRNCRCRRPPRYNRRQHDPHQIHSGRSCTSTGFAGQGALPDAPLAYFDQWEVPARQSYDTLIHRIKLELKNRRLDGETPLKDQLRPYVTTMRRFLMKPKTFSDIVEGVDKGNIYRKVQMARPLSLTDQGVEYANDMDA